MMKIPEEKPLRPASELEIMRKEKDAFFRTHLQSPLTREQKKSFKGLRYYPENPQLRFETPVDRFEKPERIEMQTSTGQVQSYLRIGRIHFMVESGAAELTVYQDDHGAFLPFVDAGAGKETYGAGRYLEPELAANGNLILDFNLAYNPYCAYNELYSCPLTPFENRLKVPVRAGEMLPEGDWVYHPEA